VLAFILIILAVLRWVIGHPLADVPLALPGLLLFAYVKPYRTCRWCRPGGLIRGSVIARMAGHEPKRRRRRGCWRCKGTKLTRRLGAKQVHKVKLALLQARDERR
jgi:hypothetical protein